ncbi:MAG: hemin uptake protein HemP [Roseobacter sp.]
MTFHLPPEKQQPVNPLPTYAARDLTDGKEQAQIVLDHQTYTLRITRAGKLILTK